MSYVLYVLLLPFVILGFVARILLLALEVGWKVIK